MCGIAGIVGSLKSSDRALLNKSLCSLRHRGPDSGASWFSPKEQLHLAIGVFL